MYTNNINMILYTSVGNWQQGILKYWLVNSQNFKIPISNSKSNTEKEKVNKLQLFVKQYAPSNNRVKQDVFEKHYAPGSNKVKKKSYL